MSDEDERSNYGKGLRYGPKSTTMTSRDILEVALAAYAAEALSGGKTWDEVLRIASSYQKMLCLIDLMAKEAEIQETDHVPIAIIEESDVVTSPSNVSPKAPLLKEPLQLFSSHLEEEIDDSKRKVSGIMGSHLQLWGYFSCEHGIHEICSSQLDITNDLDDNSRLSRIYRVNISACLASRQGP